ncbi:MAG: GIY-YIG nuclease family protein [Phycisphaerales bacterium]|nr:GIY-YIG nuclease family protein [Phycisphaerales bacterium]
MSKRHRHTCGTIEAIEPVIRLSNRQYRFIYHVDGEKYCRYSDVPVDPLKVGDFVEFSWVGRSRSRHSYRSIRGEVTIVRASESVVGASGYIYILVNAAYEKLVKIGLTTRTPEERCAELSASTGVPKPFRVYWSLAVFGDVRAVEATVHQDLKALRRGKEFFQISPIEAKQAIIRVYTFMYPEQAHAIDNADARRLAYQQAAAASRQAFREAQAKVIQAPVASRPPPMRFVSIVESDDSRSKVVGWPLQTVPDPKPKPIFRWNSVVDWMVVIAICIGIAATLSVCRMM